ncbi:hypothetical protein [Actinomadura nitritigenes]|uniref:hypothetical protein n=1 Tax=Actinomadura nitritigenes TaxID=134602 RepID=UPI003D9268F3
MWQTIVLSGLGGVVGGNALPHFVRGITRERYPNLTGNGPLPNLVGGWAGLVVALLLVHWADPGRHPGWAFGSAAAGVLLIGLFHAGPGAFGRKETPTPAAPRPGPAA